jgi:hypothetical protein
MVGIQSGLLVCSHVVSAKLAGSNYIDGVGVDCAVDALKALGGRVLPGPRGRLVSPTLC